MIRTYILSLSILLGVLVSSIYGSSAPSEFGKVEEGLSINFKQDAQWEGLFYYHRSSPLKKCFTSLFFERATPVILPVAQFRPYQENFLPSRSYTTIFGHITINAP